MIYYDLTELYYLSRGPIKFYGIARVIAEIASEIAEIDTDIVFVVYDESRRRFFQISPVFDKASDTDLITLGIDRQSIPAPLYTVRDTAPALLKTLVRAGNALRRFQDRKRLSGIPDGLMPVAMKSGILFSAARPKIIVRIADQLQINDSAVKLVPLLHDCIPLHGSKIGRKGKAFRADTAKAIAGSSRIIANSHFTLEDLEAFSQKGWLPALPENPAVVQLAHECRGTGEAPDWDLPERPFVLGVGMTLGRNKNLEVVLRAQEAMLSRGQTPPLLVLAGMQRPRMIRKLQSRFPTYGEYVRLIDSPPQPHLIALYRSALATVVASHLEGWGLPSGESLWLGTPVISSNASALPEVGGDLAVYFDPDNAEQLADIFTRFLTNPSMVAKTRNRIAIAHQDLRSWKTVAKDLLAVLREEEQLPTGTMAGRDSD